MIWMVYKNANFFEIIYDESTIMAKFKWRRRALLLQILILLHLIRIREWEVSDMDTVFVEILWYDDFWDEYNIEWKKCKFNWVFYRLIQIFQYLQRNKVELNFTLHHNDKWISFWKLHHSSIHINSILCWNNWMQYIL